MFFAGVEQEAEYEEEDDEEENEEDGEDDEEDNEEDGEDDEEEDEDDQCGSWLRIRQAAVVRRITRVRSLFFSGTGLYIGETDLCMGSRFVRI